MPGQNLWIFTRRQVNKLICDMQIHKWLVHLHYIAIEYISFDLVDVAICNKMHFIFYHIAGMTKSHIKWNVVVCSILHCQSMGTSCDTADDFMQFYIFLSSNKSIPTYMQTWLHAKLLSCPRLIWETCRVAMHDNFLCDTVDNEWNPVEYFCMQITFWYLCLSSVEKVTLLCAWKCFIVVDDTTSDPDTPQQLMWHFF